MVRITGVEPALKSFNKDLNLARLPIPPYPQTKKYFSIFELKRQDKLTKYLQKNLKIQSPSSTQNKPKKEILTIKQTKA